MMKKIMVIFNDTLNAYGGSHTLILRMCKWLRLNGVETCVFCTKVSNTEMTNSLKELGVLIENVGNYSLYKVKKTVKKYISKKREIKVINFTLDKWLDLEVVKKIYRYEIENIIYDIHPETFHKGKAANFNFIKKYVKRVVCKLVKKISENNAIVAMEELNILSTRDFLNLDASQYCPEIIRLPMVCNRKRNFDEIIEKGFDSNVIMSAARADFPFKGYLIGLIDDFVCLKKRYPSLKLLYVVAGPSLSVLMDKVKTLPNSISKDISINNWLPYQKLLDEIQNCKIFVGMGTSVLDAALQYKPVLTAAYNTYENKTSGFFSDNPFILASSVDEAKEAFAFLDIFFDEDYIHYKDRCIKNFDTVFMNYNIDKLMPALLSLETKKKYSLLTLKESLIHVIHMCLNRFRYRNELKMDYYAQNIGMNINKRL